MSQAQTQSVAKMSKTDKEATLKHLCADGQPIPVERKGGETVVGQFS